MKISGLQKMTLLDYPGKVACTVFLGGCNLRCPFCHNSELLGQNAPQFIMADELFAFLQKRQGLLEAGCISGGEPTLQPKLSEFISKIKELNFLVKLDTNGYRPDVLRQLLEDGLLDYVAMDVKNEYVTLEGAEKIYGVIVDPETFAVAGITAERKKFHESK